MVPLPDRPINNPINKLRWMYTDLRDFSYRHARNTVVVDANELIWQSTTREVLIITEIKNTIDEALNEIND